MPVPTGRALLENGGVRSLGGTPKDSCSVRIEVDPGTWRALMLDDLKQREPLRPVAVLLAGVAGARRGELCGLWRLDIDEAGGQVHGDWE